MAMVLQFKFDFLLLPYGHGASTDRLLLTIIAKTNGDPQVALRLLALFSHPSASLSESVKDRRCQPGGFFLIRAVEVSLSTLAE